MDGSFEFHVYKYSIHSTINEHIYIQTCRTLNDWRHRCAVNSSADVRCVCVRYIFNHNVFLFAQPIHVFMLCRYYRSVNVSFSGCVYDILVSISYYHYYSILYHSFSLYSMFCAHFFLTNINWRGVLKAMTWTSE